MAITKTGQITLPKYLGNLGAKGFRFVANVLDKDKKAPGAARLFQLPLQGIRRMGAAAAKVTPGIAAASVRGLGSAGRFLYSKPKWYIPGVALGYLGYKQVDNNLKRNMFHIDPNYNLTHSNLLGNIEYNHPESKEQYEKLNLLNI